jgi:hypothetical protein
MKGDTIGKDPKQYEERWRIRRNKTPEVTVKHFVSLKQILCVKKKQTVILCP